MDTDNQLPAVAANDVALKTGTFTSKQLLPPAIFLIVILIGIIVWSFNNDQYQYPSKQLTVTISPESEIDREGGVSMSQSVIDGVYYATELNIKFHTGPDWIRLDTESMQSPVSVVGKSVMFQHVSEPCLLVVADKIANQGVQASFFGKSESVDYRFSGSWYVSELMRGAVEFSQYRRQFLAGEYLVTGDLETSFVLWNYDNSSVSSGCEYSLRRLLTTVERYVEEGDVTLTSRGSMYFERIHLKHGSYTSLMFAPENATQSFALFDVTDTGLYEHSRFFVRANKIFGFGNDQIISIDPIRHSLQEVIVLPSGSEMKVNDFFVAKDSLYFTAIPVTQTRCREGMGVCNGDLYRYNFDTGISELVRTSVYAFIHLVDGDDVYVTSTRGDAGCVAARIDKVAVDGDLLTIVDKVYCDDETVEYEKIMQDIASSVQTKPLESSTIAIRDGLLLPGSPFEEIGSSIIFVSSQ